MDDLERVKQGTASQLSKQFYTGSTVADPSVVTVTVTRDDGTVIASGTAGGTGTSPRTFTLTTTHTALLDKLTVLWASPSLGTLNTTVEVVGGFHFSTARARRRLTDTTTYPDADIQAARTWAESEIENAAGVAFVPRYERETLNGSGRQRLEPKWPRIRAVRSVTVDGTPLSSADLAGVVIEYDRFLTRPYYYWRPWVSNVLIRYEHGYDQAPPGISVAALDLACYKLINDNGGGVDPRAERLITDDGTILLGAAGGPGGQFPLPTVNAAVAAWSELAVW